MNSPEEVIFRALIAPPVTMINCYSLPRTPAEAWSIPAFEKIQVNQGTATKTKAVSAIEHVYPIREGSTTAHQVWNIFNVQPRQHEGRIAISVLERHPFTTQTFIPLDGEKDAIEYLVVIADDLNDKPNITSLRAYLCKGNQSVTYGINQWHAPMISLKKDLTFCVTNAENGTSDDCEEHFFRDDSVPLVDITRNKESAQANTRQARI